ncbi:MAG: ATP-binding protein [Acidimicrobiales bacterium]
MEPSAIRFGIPPSTASVGPARDKLRQALAACTAPLELVGDAELVLTELVTNAIQHAAPPIEVELRLEDQGLTVEVIDHSPGVPPCLQPPDLDRIGGWGLAILATVTEAWGFTAHPEHKVVWARLAHRPA